MKRPALALLLLFLGSAQAENMGRLFYTPEQRLTLDNARRQKVKVEEKSEERVPEIVSLNGVVKRSDGHTTVWLNNRAISDQHTGTGVGIHPQGAASDPVLFTIPQVDRAVRMRVGQNLDVTTGQVVEPYHPRAAEMKRALSASVGGAGAANSPVEATASRSRSSGALPDSRSAEADVRASTPSYAGARPLPTQPSKDGAPTQPDGVAASSQREPGR
jgi:hypothetical protein